MAKSDDDLIARVLAGDDRRAFTQLVERHQGAVRGTLRRLTGGDHALADDLAQETFLRAYRHLASYRGAASFTTWLLRIAYHLFVSHTRKRTEEPVDPAELSRSTQAAAEPSHARRDLERALRALPSSERAALALTYARDLTHVEAAEILGCPLGTLKTLVSSAKQRLRRHLSEGVDDDDR